MNLRTSSSWRAEKIHIHYFQNVRGWLITDLENCFLLNKMEYKYKKIKIYINFPKIDEIITKQKSSSWA